MTKHYVCEELREPLFSREQVIDAWRRGLLVEGRTQKGRWVPIGPGSSVARWLDGENLGEYRMAKISGVEIRIHPDHETKYMDHLRNRGGRLELLRGPDVGKLATSDPVAHQQAIADAQADQDIPRDPLTWAAPAAPFDPFARPVIEDHAPISQWTIKKGSNQ